MIVSMIDQLLRERCAERARHAFARHPGACAQGEHGEHDPGEQRDDRVADHVQGRPHSISLAEGQFRDSPEQH